MRINFMLAAVIYTFELFNIRNSEIFLTITLFMKQLINLFLNI